MSIVDLHPEELLDRYAHGALSEADLARLHAHVATCAVCRFELAARGDFAEEAAAVLGAPDGVAPQPAETMPGPRPADRAEEAPVQPPARAVARPRRRAWIAGLAAALIGGMSFAALSTGVLRSFERAPAGAHVPPRGHVTRAASAAPATEVEATRAATPVAPAAPAQPESAAQVGASPESASNRAARVVHAPTAAELFRTANAARRAHEPERAIALYRELESRYPRSEEARVSYATLGSLMLDRGDPRAALDGFNRYLSRGETALGEEALVGRALSSRKLGARENELAAWQEVLRRFPSSIHAELARSRLADLGER